MTDKTMGIIASLAIVVALLVALLVGMELRELRIIAESCR